MLTRGRRRSGMGGMGGMGIPGGSHAYTERVAILITWPPSFYANPTASLSDRMRFEGKW